MGTPPSHQTNVFLTKNVTQLRGSSLIFHFEVDLSAVDAKEHHNNKWLKHKYISISKREPIKDRPRVH